ncbi:MAG: SprT-like domain-containing protein [Oscillospiraceae bacterium]|nr:SprT-like domain-containing protein [Oscillospiraceae bacterium]
MHTMQEIRREYERLDRICSVDTSCIEIRVNNAQRRLGSFSCRADIPDGKMVITISRRAMEDESLFLDTIRHEYAHAVVFLRHPRVRHGHDAVWKAVCREVGCMPRGSVRPGASETDLENSAKYRVTCRSCGAVTYYIKAGKIVKLLQQNAGEFGNTAKVLCRKCGGSSFDLKELQ